MSSDEKYDKIINISSCKYTYNLPIHKDFIRKKNNPYRISESLCDLGGQFIRLRLRKELIFSRGLYAVFKRYC